MSFRRLKLQCINSFLKYSTDTKMTRIISMPNETVSRTKRAEMVKARHRENKEMFGELLETKQDKVSRRKKTAEQTGPYTDAMPQEIVFVAVKQLNQGPKVECDNFKRPTSTIVPLASIPMEPAVDIAKHGDLNGEKKTTKAVESKWMTKNFAKRTKIFTKVPPPVNANLDPTTPPLYKQSTVSETSSTPRATNFLKAEMTPREIREIPTLKQFLASIHQCQDISHYGEVKQIREGGITGLTTAEATDSPPRVSSVDANEEDKDKTEEPIITERGSTEINGPNTSSSHDSLSSQSLDDLRLGVGNEEDMISAGYKLFPFDNPGRQTSDDRDLPASLPAQIQSLPYPQAGNYSTSSSLHSNPKFPSVTRILTATMSAQQLKILKLWEEKMMRELGEDGFKRYKEELFANGKLLHKNLQFLLSGKSIDDLDISQGIEGHWQSLQGVLAKIQKTSVLESYVAHPVLCYGGIVDCIATYRDKLVLIDWKTSEKPKPFISNTYDTPIQIAAYIGAINYDPNYKFKVVEGLAVIAYKDGKDCQVFHLSSTDILKYWKLWLKRLKLYHSREP